MTRIVLGLVVLLLLSACTSDGGGDDVDEGASGKVDAQTLKEQVDSEARTLLPDLVHRLGGRLVGMRATFSERGGFGIWDYAADGGLEEPPGTMADALAAAAAVLEKHQYSVDTDEAQKRVTGRKGNVSVQVEAALLSDDRAISRLDIRMGSYQPTSEGDDFAHSAPPEDYLAYVD